MSTRFSGHAFLSRVILTDFLTRNTPNNCTHLAHARHDGERVVEAQLERERRRRRQHRKLLRAARHPPAANGAPRGAEKRAGSPRVVARDAPAVALAIIARDLDAHASRVCAPLLAARVSACNEEARVAQIEACLRGGRRRPRLHQHASQLEGGHGEAHERRSRLGVPSRHALAYARAEDAPRLWVELPRRVADGVEQLARMRLEKRRDLAGIERVNKGGARRLDSHDATAIRRLRLVGEPARISPVGTPRRRLLAPCTSRMLANMVHSQSPADRNRQAVGECSGGGEGVPTTRRDLRVLVARGAWCGGAVRAG